MRNTMAERTRPVRRPLVLIFSALMLGVLGYTFAQVIVAPALPAIEKTLHSTTAFVLTAFLLTASVATPIVGVYSAVWANAWWA